MNEALSLRVVAAARGWIGTPYRHQASRRGVGCDCLGLVRGVWREIYGQEPEAPGPYQPDWGERAGEDRLLTAAIRHFGQPVALGGMNDGGRNEAGRKTGGTADDRKTDGTWHDAAVRADATQVGQRLALTGSAGMGDGDVLLFRWRPGLAAKHLGILSAADRFIHAYEQAAVIESPLVPAWRRRICAVFRFPPTI